jgi:hypothetical protein
MGARNTWFLMPTYGLEIIVISVITTASIYMVLARTGNPRLFVNLYLLTIVMKLIFFSALLLMMRFIAPQSLTPNAVLILVAYILFTALEVGVLFAKVNR